MLNKQQAFEFEAHIQKDHRRKFDTRIFSNAYIPKRENDHKGGINKIV